MNTYTKDGKRYEIGVRSDGSAAIGTVTVLDKHGNPVGYAEGVEATVLIHREFNADGTPRTHHDPERTF